MLAALAGCVSGSSPARLGDTASREISERALLSGEELFTLACARCHAADGRGGPAGPDLADRARDLGLDEIVSVVRDGSGAMAPVPLSEAEARTVAAFLIDVIVTGDTTADP